VQSGSALRSQAVLAISFVGRIVLALAMTWIIGRKLPADEFGFFALIGAIYYIGHEIMNLGLVSVSVREIVRDPTRERPLLEGLLMWRRLCGVALALVLTGVALHEEDPRRRLVLLATAASFVLLTPWALYAVFQVRQAQEGPTAVGIFGHVFVVVGSLVCIAARIAGPYFALLIVARELLVTAAIRVLAVRRLGYSPKPGLRGRGLGTFVRAAAVYGMAAIGHSLYVHVDVFIVRYVRGEAELGAYAAAFRPMMTLMAIPGTLMVPLLPLFTAAAFTARERFAAHIEGLTTLFCGLGLIAATGGVMLAPDVLELLYERRYLDGDLDATAALRWLSIAFGALFAASAFPTALLASGRELTLLVLVGIGLTTNTLLNLVFVPTFGFTAAAATTAATEIMFALLVMATTTRHLGRRVVSFGIRRALLACAVLGGALALLEAPPVVRLIVGVLLGCVGAAFIARDPKVRAILAELKARRDVLVAEPAEAENDPV